MPHTGASKGQRLVFTLLEAKSPEGGAGKAGPGETASWLQREVLAVCSCGERGERASGFSSLGPQPSTGAPPQGLITHRPHLPTPAPAGRTPHLSADTAFRQQHPSSSRTSFTWSHSSHLYPSHPQGILLPNVPFKSVAQTEILKINQEYCL